MNFNSVDMKQIWNEVKADHARLASCSGPHEFGPLIDVVFADPRYTCSKCKGTIRGHDRFWYERGLRDGSKLCGGALIWVPGEDGMQTTCPDCGKELFGLLDDPANYPICMERRAS